MVANQTESILKMVQRIVPQEDAALVVESLNTAWRRAAKGSDKSPPLALGNFSRDRADLTALEHRYVISWLEKRANIAPQAAPSTTPSVSNSVDINAAIQKAVDKQTAKLKQEYEERLNTETQKQEAQKREAVEADRKKQKLIHEADIATCIAAEKQRLQQENEAKLEREKQKLQQQFAGNSSQQIQSEKQNAVLTAKATIAEEKAKLVLEFNEKMEDKIQQALNKKEAEFAKEKRQLIAVHQMASETWATEKQELLLKQEEAIAKWNNSRQATEAANEAQDARLAELEAEIAELTKPKREWWRLSEYDIVNVTSNIFAAFSLVNMLQQYGLLAALILIATFLGVTKALKKSESKWSGIIGIIGIGIVEFIYGTLHTTFFKDILKGREHLPFGMNYEQMADALAIVISGASLFVAIMNFAQARDNAAADKKENLITD